MMQKKAYKMSKRPKQLASLWADNLPKISTIIQWWYQQRHAWPMLAKFAIEILSIAAMSDDVERVFSGARRTVSWERAKLGIDKIEAVECLDSWVPCKLEVMIDRLDGLQAGEIEEIEGDEVSEHVIINVEDIDDDQE
jgi:hAT family C-terminal dimerisation region